MAFGGTMSFGGIRLVPLKRLRMVRKIKLKNTNTKVYNNEANYYCYLRSQVSAIFSMRTLYL